MDSLKLILSRKRYFSVVWVFCSLNIMFGTWILYIPQVKQKLVLNDSQIGFAMFCLALGVLCFIPLVPIISKKIGIGKSTFFGICVFSMVFLIPVVAHTYILLCAALFMVGMFSGFTDVTMNTLVSELEKRDEVNFMSAAHGFFSLGGAIGALLGTFLMVYIEVPLFHLSLMAIIVVVTNLILVSQYFKIRETETRKSEDKLPLKSFRPLVVLALLAMIVMGNEGAIEHWSSIYFTEVIAVASDNMVGLGFTVFSIMMTVGRFFGDGISEKIGSVRIIVLGCSLAALGYVFVLLSHLILSAIGFGIIGLGLSVVIPELLRVAGKTEHISASKSISFVSGVGFVGFLVGPIILGYISDYFDLQISFSFLLVLILLAVVLTRLKLNSKTS
ncbi:MFS transporter [Winogradskyella sp.]|uniref:MFS transporter n=1 Tax=Winogradskyella sp. TaxID=1883156 RepID=UPI003BA954FF